MALQSTRNSPGICRPLGRRVAASRSQVTNGKRLFVDGDGQSPWARRWRDLVELHAADIGPAQSLSEAQLSLIRRVSTLEIEMERMEGQLSQGGDADLDIYMRASGHLRRLLETLGIERAKRDVASVPSLSEYLSQRQLGAGSE
jgi:hypothetical protein